MRLTSNIGKLLQESRHKFYEPSTKPVWWRWSVQVVCSTTWRISRQMLISNWFYIWWLCRYRWICCYFRSASSGRFWNHRSSYSNSQFFSIFDLTNSRYNELFFISLRGLLYRESTVYSVLPTTLLFCNSEFHGEFEFWNKKQQSNKQRVLLTRVLPSIKNNNN